MTGIVPFSPISSDSMAVGVGAVCGALCRHHAGRLATERIAKDPKLKALTGWHTAGINILGSFILGGVFSTPLREPQNSIIAKSAKQNCGFALSPRMKLLVGVGFCGAFTTFSTFSVDVVNMINKGELMRASSYIAVNNVGGVCAAGLGMMMAKRVFSR